MLRIIVADNVSIFLAGVARTLALQEGIGIVAQCTDRERLLDATLAHRSSIVVFASSLNVNLQRILQIGHAAGNKLVVLAEDPESLRKYTSLGFDGVAFRNLTPPELVTCVRRVGAGEKYVQRTYRASMVDGMDEIGSRVRARLKPKEMQMVALVGEGYKNKEIASRLGTSEQVIKNSLKAIYDKTGVSDRLGLALLTIHHRPLAEAAKDTLLSMENEQYALH